MHDIDFERARLIRESTPEQLADEEYIKKLMLRLGMNDEEPEEQPREVLDNSGGLRIWQYPNQFAKYILKARELGVKSYLEIGCRWGGTFVLTTEYLKKTCGLERSVAVDLIESPVREYCQSNKGCLFIPMDSQSPAFARYMDNKRFDMILIDGLHTLMGVTVDFLACRRSSDIFVFHDITNDACPEVGVFWDRLKQNNEFETHEFTEQYPEVTERTNMRFLGIGMAVRKKR
jgi:hypothetical protein